MAFGTIVDSSVLLDAFTDDERWALRPPST